MDKFELDKIIKTLGENAPNNEAYFGLTDDDYPDIEANEAGLMLFSRQLLKAIRLFEDRENSMDKSINIEHGDWCKIHGIFNAVKPVYESRYEFLKTKVAQKSYKNKLNDIIATITLLLIVTLIVTGAITVFNWIF